jgi:hypothetical protein
MKDMILNAPRAIQINLNPDETLHVYVKAMQISGVNGVRVAGAIEREDSAAFRRTNHPLVKDFFGFTMLVVKYDEFDDNDGGQIHVEFIMTQVPHA